MDSDQLSMLVKRIPRLKFKFVGVFAADNFPPLRSGKFQIINTQKSNDFGLHWVLIANRGGEIIFGDPLAFRLEFYQDVFQRASQYYAKIREIVKSPLQEWNSIACGQYCVYIARSIYSKYYPNIPIITELELKRFLSDRL